MLVGYTRNIRRETEKDNKNMTIIDTLRDAILASGKSFEQIPKDSIIQYLNKTGISKSTQEEIYNKLVDIYAVSENLYESSPDSPPPPPTTAKTKERQPRKNVFSEITKIH